MTQRPASRSLISRPALALLLVALAVSPALGQDLAAEAGVARLVAATGGDANVRLDPVSGVARFVRMEGVPLKVAGATSEAKAANFFEAYGDAFGIRDAASELRLAGVESSFMTHVTYDQTYRGLPVFAGQLRAHFDSAGNLRAVNGKFAPGLSIDVEPALAAGDAAEIAIRTVRKHHAGGAGELAAVGGRLMAYRAGLLRSIPGRDHLVYEVEVADPTVSIRDRVYVDGHTGAVVDRISMIHEALDRKVSETTLANVVWQDSTGDPDPIPPGWAGGTPQQIIDWQDEIDGARETYNTFGSMSGGAYLSYDGADATMRTVNNDPTINCPNANWNGVSTNYCTGVTADDVVSHEWGHAYTEYTNGLIYAWQSGALNESYSDIWGETIDLINGRGTDAPDNPRSAGGCSIFNGGAPDNSYRWLLGEDATAFGTAIRDMWNPTCEGDPGKVSDQAQYECTTFDGGGVHINSGIPNHAYALMVDGGTYNGQTVTGIGLTKAARIHWEAQQMLAEGSEFPDHADQLEAACANLIGATLYELDHLSPTGTVSADVISAADCAEVANAIAATELRLFPAFCNWQPMLDPNAPALCDGQGAVVPIFSEDWESGLGAWTAGTRAVVNPATFSTPDWAVVSSLPDGEPGSAAFVADPILGDCVTDVEAGVLFLESPVISIPAGSAAPRVAFDHWVATEVGWDGGNVKASVNGGAYGLIPGSAFTFNAYPGSLQPAPSDNPLAGEEAFTGTDEGTVNGSWGQSQVDLTGIAAAGDDVQLRFEMGLDGCNGIIGWYVDEVEVYSCAGECGNGLLDPGETCDDGNSVPGDGCSDTCQVEPGWECTDPIPPTPPANVVADGSFEAGTPNPSWAEASTNFGTPVCSQGTCGGPAPSDGLWHVWFGGIPVFEAGSVEQSVVIPTTATSLDFDLTVGVCDSLNDYMRVRIDGTQVFTTDPCTAGPPATESVAIGAYADGAAHALRFESEVFGTNGGNSNFFLDNVVISDGGDPGSPSVCEEVACDPENGPTWGKWNLPPAGGTIFGISGRLDDPSGTQVYYFRADLTDTGGGGIISGTLHDSSVLPAYDVRGTYVENPFATTLSGTFSARILEVGTTNTVGKMAGKWADRSSVNSIGRYKGRWKICD